MARCSRCNGCTSMWSDYRPTWCEDVECPEGDKEPEGEQEELTKRFNEALKAFNLTKTQ